MLRTIIFKVGEGKGTSKEVKVLLFTQSVKTSTPGISDKLHMYKVIPKAVIKKTIKQYT